MAEPVTTDKATYWDGETETGDPHKGPGNLLFVASILAFVALTAIFSTTNPISPKLASQFRWNYQIAESMRYDNIAWSIDTIQARTTAVDHMVRICAHCLVRHRSVASAPDVITINCDRPVSAAKARGRAAFAVDLYADVRSRYMSRADALRITVFVYDNSGRLMARVRGSDVYGSTQYTTYPEI